MSGIRNATLLDLQELSRLAKSAAYKLAGYLTRGYMLVLDRGDGHLDAACHVDVSESSSSIDLLVVDPSIHDENVEHRLVGVAHALCEAYGRPMPPLSPTRSRGRR